MAALKVKGNWTKIPVNNQIFGGFIESGFGRQVDGLWSEMLYNRAFREVEPMKIATWEWVGVDADHYNSEMPSWHSGYEENDWEDIGTPIRSYTCGSHTYKGLTSLVLKNEKEGLCGLKQGGIHLQKDRKYVFHVFAGVRGRLEEAGLNGFGETIQEEDTKGKPLTVRIGSSEMTCSLQTIPERFDWEFTAEKTEVTEISLTFDWEGSLVLSCASLMPADNLSGFRADVIEELKKAAPSVVRFPGGCFVSFYDWQRTIGDRDKREPQTSFYWGGLEENDLGLDEFMEMARLVGFEPQLCFNMMSSEPFNARQLVEYLNAPSDVGMGRLRMLNGHEAPYGVRLFEMDNEPGRKWSPKQYSEKCVEFAREMRLADPDIELMFAAYVYPPQVLPQMLEIAGKDIDYVIYRQGSPEFVRKILPVIRTYNEKNGTNLKLVNTEWLASCYSIEPFENPDMPTTFRWRGAVTNNYLDILGTHQISWNYALNGAHRLMDYITYGGEFALANFNNMCNTWGQNIVEASKDKSWLSCMGQVFAFFARVFEDCTASEVDCGDSRFFAVMTRTESGKEQLYLVNHSSQAIETELPEGNWCVTDGLLGSGRMAHATEEANCVRMYTKACSCGGTEAAENACDQQKSDTFEVEICGNQMTVPALSLLCLEKK